MMYPFALGDLRDSVVCLQNYMENSSGRVPWEDLRYIFGEIMYGGHIVNDFDRLLVNRYLEHFLRDELLEEMELFPFNKDEKASFKTPNPTTFDRYLEHIDQAFPAETPVAIGLHPNAAIQTASEGSDSLMRQLLELQPRDGGAAGGEEKTPRMIAAAAMAEISEAIADVKWEVDDFQSSMNPEDVGPFQNVLILELKALNRLAAAMRSSLATLRMGFEGRLTMSESMEKLEEELSLDKVPSSWAKLAWPSLRLLGAWKFNLTQRVLQLSEWFASPLEPVKCLWLGGLVNPQSYLTAIKQTTAQRQSLELDRLAIQTEVTKKFAEEIDAGSRDGAFLTGFFITGATFDPATSTIEKSRPRQMETALPVVNVKSVLIEKLDLKGVFEAPVYTTQQRGPTFIFCAQLTTKSPAARWSMAGVCLLLDAS
jgi:dynein heavy chain